MAFALVEEWQGVEEYQSTVRYKDTFFPLLVQVARIVRNATCPVPTVDLDCTEKLRNLLRAMCKASGSRLEWMLRGDQKVEKVIDRAVTEAYVDSPRLGGLSEPYVRSRMKKVAKKLIACCVRLNLGRRVLSETSRLVWIVRRVTDQVESDADFIQVCKNHLFQTKRSLDFENC